MPWIMKESADMQSLSRRRPRTASHSSASAQRPVGGGFPSSNPPSHPKTEHSGPSSGDTSFTNKGPGSQFNNVGGPQNNNTGSGNQYINQTSRRDKENQILKSLYKSPYKDRKDRNPPRVPGTCEWFVSHKLFQEWQESKSSKMLWVSADPGCGKSVLVRYLVDSILPITDARRVCYFFFKDIKDQKNVEGALCCILRQLFKQNRILLSDEILDQFDTGGEMLNSSFSELWQILVNVANDANAGEIVCLLDAIDECEDQGRAQLSKALCRLYSAENKNLKLKFLVTSRPERQIYCDFKPLKMPGLPVIHLSGESEVEMKKISQEVDIFIKASVKRIGAKLELTTEDQDLLFQQVMRADNRSYLWVYLTLEGIEDEVIDDKDAIIHVTSRLPKTVDEAYDRILCKGGDFQNAKKILHIIVAAARPLSLREMAFALALQEDCRSYDDIELENEDRVRQKIRNICGLIVTIVDSRIYLLHQTVKEFLVGTNNEDSRKDTHGNFTWKHALQPQESHRILAEICIQHLLFSDFETHTLYGNQSLSHYAERYIFIEYSAKHWAAHYRELQIKVQDAMVQSVLRICDANSRRYLIWFTVYWTTINMEFPRGFTTFMTASYFGLETAVMCLLEMNGIDLNHRDETYWRSALSWAAGNGFHAVLKFLIKGTPIGLKNLQQLFKRVKVDLGDRFGQTPLSYAVWNGNVAAIETLIKAGARVNLKDDIGGTPLSYAVCSGRHEVMELLFKNGAKVGLGDDINRDLMFSASEQGHVGVVKLLLDRGQVDINEADTEGLTPLHWAARNGHEAVVKLLLDTGQADMNKADCDGFTPILLAKENGDLHVIRLLLNNGQTDISREDYERLTIFAMFL